MGCKLHESEKIGWVVFPKEIVESKRLGQVLRVAQEVKKSRTNYVCNRSCGMPREYRLN